MKLVYTILFFADTVLLLVLAYFIVRLCNARTSEMTLALLFLGLLGSIISLVYILFHYLRLPSSERHY